ncbi:transporter [Orrella sp. 11846]|uniref:transporter n=1 Tax=Orrella sp. 11846 TaxID=3409913 RepID=UPI003B5BF588
MLCKKIFIAKPLKTALALGILTTSANAFAFSPLQTEDSGTQGQYHGEVELGYNYERTTSLDLEEDNRVDVFGHGSSIPGTFTFGLTDRLDASIGVSRQLTPVKGWQNTELGLKWNFLGEPDSGWSAAIKPTLILPLSTSSQNKDLGNARTNWGMALIGSYTTEKYELHGNLKYTSNYRAKVIDVDDQRAHLWTVSVSPVWNINEQWKLGMEVGLETSADYSSHNQGFTQLAVSYSPIDNLTLGLGVGFNRAFGSPSKDRGLSVATTLAYQF